MMNKVIRVSIGFNSVVLGALVAANCLACGTGGSTITNLPTLGGTVLNVYGLNAAGQITGYSFIQNDTSSHAFLYTNGLPTDLGTLGGSTSIGYAINGSGQVAGQSDVPDYGQYHAFLYSQGSLQDLGTLGGSYSSAAAINNAGQVAGVSTLLGDSAQAAFLYANGSMTNLGTLGGNSSSANAINSAGAVAGASSTADFESHGFVYAGGTMTDIGTLGGGYSTAFAINDLGVVVGESYTTNYETHAIAYVGGVLTDLGTLGGTYSTATDINAAGQVIGQATTTNDVETHAFIFGGGTMTDLGSLGGGYSLPDAINGLGAVVGSSSTADNASHAFLYQNGQMVDLNSLLLANSGWVLSDAFFINDSGRIVGDGTYNNAGAWFIMDVVTGGGPPVADAGPDQTVECASQVTLDASHSSSPSNDPLTYEWSLNGNVLGNSVKLTGSLLLGTNIITLKVTDSCGASAQTNVIVYVVDTAAPTILGTPGPITVSADASGQATVPSVVGQVVASDACTAANQLVITQSPVAGTVVGTGQHPITVTAADTSSNQSTATVAFQVIDTTPPTIVSTPPPITVSADAQCQATVPNVVGQVVASDNCTAASQLVITQSPAAGTVVGSGQYSITVTVTDAAGNHSATTVAFQVNDTTAPTIGSTPAPITVSANASGQATVPSVVGQVVASDNCTAANQLVITQSPAAGTVVGIGQHPITVTVTDAAGNHATATVAFQVNDTTPPTIVSTPAPITVSANASGQATVPSVVGQVVASDNGTAANQLVITQSPAAGTVVGTGQHPITVTVTDAAGNHATASVAFQVNDTTPPTIVSTPAPITVSANAAGKATVPSVVGQVVASDNCTPPNQLVITQSPAAGTVVGLGQSSITVTVKDAAGNSATTAVSFRVVDTTPPVIQSVTATPNVLSPANGKPVAVTVAVSASDNCDPSPVSKITSVACNAPTAAGDIKITGNLTVSLVASKGPSATTKIYTITVSTTDASGNSSTATVTVTVPGK
jgi:probable HAF family extracellular repeat protein